MLDLDGDLEPELYQFVLHFEASIQTFDLDGDGDVDCVMSSVPLAVKDYDNDPFDADLVGWGTTGEKIDVDGDGDDDVVVEPFEWMSSTFSFTPGNGNLEPPSPPSRPETAGAGGAGHGSEPPHGGQPVARESRQS